MSVDRVFIDTNVLTYVFDDSEPEKQARAEELLARETREIFVSTQVLQELYVSLTKGREPITSAEIAERAVREVAAYSIIQIDAALVLSAIELSRAQRLSFWDALIVRAAAEGGCGVLISEDLNDGQIVDGVQVQNPFR
ncbi:MAG TPA: PIN domain-containing protein [Polyangiaceae bacterium]|nr:PIN domain-containing protein [Polyangiaceae bacterium]